MRDDADCEQVWINQSGGLNDLVTHSVNKYVTCTHNAKKPRQVSIWKMLLGGDIETSIIAFT